MKSAADFLCAANGSCSRMKRSADFLYAAHGSRMKPPAHILYTADRRIKRRSGKILYGVEGPGDVFYEVRRFHGHAFGFRVSPCLWLLGICGNVSDAAVIFVGGRLGISKYPSSWPGHKQDMLCVSQFRPGGAAPSNLDIP